MLVLVGMIDVLVSYERIAGFFDGMIATISDHGKDNGTQGTAVIRRDRLDVDVEDIGKNLKKALRFAAASDDAGGTHVEPEVAHGVVDIVQGEADAFDDGLDDVFPLVEERQIGKVSFGLRVVDRTSFPGQIGQEEDIDAILYASTCGVKILASTHADSMETFIKKALFQKLIKEKVFKRYVLLSKRNGPGTNEGIYNENFSRISSSF